LGTLGIFEFELEPHLWQRAWFKVLAPTALTQVPQLGGKFDRFPEVACSKGLGFKGAPSP
jgi:hypothetical protein